MCRSVIMYCTVLSAELFGVVTLVYSRSVSSYLRVELGGGGGGGVWSRSPPKFSTIPSTETLISRILFFRQT